MTQLAFEDAAHAQLPEVRVIVTLIVPPPAAGACDVDDSVYAHVGGGDGLAGDSFFVHAAAAAIDTVNAHQSLSFMRPDVANRVPVPATVLRTLAGAARIGTIRNE